MAPESMRRCCAGTAFWNGQQPKLPQPVEKEDKLTETWRDVQRSCRGHRTLAVNGGNMHPLKVQIATLVRMSMVEPSNPIFHLDLKNTKSNNIIEHCLVGDTWNVTTLTTRLD